MMVSSHLRSSCCDLSEGSLLEATGPVRGHLQGFFFITRECSSLYRLRSCHIHEFSVRDTARSENFGDP